MSAVTLIQTVTVGSGGAASIEFGTGGTIPQTFDDLMIVLSARTTIAQQDEVLDIRFNGLDTNRTTRNLLGTGSAASSGTSTNGGDGWSTAANTTANTFSNISYYIPNYRSSVAKSYSIDSTAENNATFSIMAIIAGLWNSTAAITSIVLAPNSSNFAQHSSASLYGIKTGSSGGVVVS